MTQTELARKIKTDRSFINMLLRGKRNASATVALRLVKAVPGTKLLDWLFAKRNCKRLAKMVLAAE